MKYNSEKECLRSKSQGAKVSTETKYIDSNLGTYIYTNICLSIGVGVTSSSLWVRISVYSAAKCSLMQQFIVSRCQN